jgi:signal peptidase I
MALAPTSPAPRSQVRDYVEALAWAAVFTLVLRTFVVQAFRIPSESMEETLLVGDFLFVNKLEYGPKVPFTRLRLPGWREPRHGDVIVFQWPQDPTKDFIKRCIATGGQTVKLEHKQVYVDGRRLVEPYARHESRTEEPAGYTPRDNYSPPTVAPGELFMMGDNRDNSNDSRFWGTVPMDLVKGRALFIYFSTGGTRWWNGLFHVRFDRLLRPIR